MSVASRAAVTVGTEMIGETAMTAAATEMVAEVVGETGTGKQPAAEADGAVDSNNCRKRKAPRWAFRFFVR